TVLPLSSLTASPTAAVMVWPGLWVREEISWPAVSTITVPAATVRVRAAGAGAAGTAAGAGDGGAAGSVRWVGVVPIALCLGAEDFAPGGAGGSAVGAGFALGGTVATGASFRVAEESAGASERSRPEESGAPAASPRLPPHPSNSAAAAAEKAKVNVFMIPPV